MDSQPQQTRCFTCAGLGKLPVEFDANGQATLWITCGICQGTGFVDVPTDAQCPCEEHDACG